MSIPSLPEFFELEPLEHPTEELKELKELKELYSSLNHRNVTVEYKEELKDEGMVERRESLDLSGSFHMEDIGFQQEQPEQVLSQMDLKMIQYINERLSMLKEDNKEQIGFFSIVEGETKENKLKAFQELLALEAKDVISMKQDEPFGDIIITQKL